MHLIMFIFSFMTGLCTCMKIRTLVIISQFMLDTVCQLYAAYEQIKLKSQQVFNFKHNNYLHTQ